MQEMAVQIAELKYCSGRGVEVEEDITGGLLHPKTDMEGMTVESGVGVEEDITGDILHPKTDMEGMTVEAGVGWRWRRI